MEPGAMILIFWMLSFKSAFSLFLFIFIKRLFIPLFFLPLWWYDLYIWGVDVSPSIGVSQEIEGGKHTESSVKPAKQDKLAKVPN